MLLKDWREEKGYSLAQAAGLFGLDGANPAETWRRWEVGAHRPPDADVVAAVERFTRGAVVPSDWHAARMAFLQGREHGSLSSPSVDNGNNAADGGACHVKTCGEALHGFDRSASEGVR